MVSYSTLKRSKCGVIVNFGCNPYFVIFVQIHSDPFVTSSRVIMLFLFSRAIATVFAVSCGLRPTIVAFNTGPNLLE